MTIESNELILQRHAKRNFWLNVLDGAAFYFGTSMVSRYTVLPMFVERLSDAPWLQGLIPSLFYIGWMLPALFVAPAVAAAPRRKPWILRTTLGERIPFLILGILLLVWPDTPATPLLVIFFVLYAIMSFSAGITSTAWQDFIARLIPEKQWGIFFGLQSSAGGVLGVVGASIATTILGIQPFPQSVGILALLCFAGQVASYLFMAATVEPAYPVEPQTPLRVFLRGIIPLLKRDSAFRTYLFCRSAIALGLVGHSFLTAAALLRFSASPTEIGGYTAALMASSAISNPVLGALADRWGHKQVLELSALIGMLALILAIIVPSPLWFLLIFALVGMAQAGYQLSGYTLAFSFSTPQDRPTYIGVANTAIAPVAALGPLLAGWLASFAGYNPLFIILTVIGVLGVIAMAREVKIPLHRAG